MKKQLWLRLKRYHFDELVPAQLQDRVRALFGGSDASTQAFASKLARKLGWSQSFSLRVIHEYKKFVYLGVVSDFSVTPPKVIDQAWHEHLLFSRAYREFCRDVLERDFDHNPELVPSAEQSEAYHAQYAATLDRYREEFNVHPPHDIWGTPKFKTNVTIDRRSILNKKHATTSRSSEVGYDAPLYLLFDGSGGEGHSHDTMMEFGGGGGASGGGGGSDWNGSDHSSHSSHSGHSSHDSSHSDSGSSDSGSDGGGSGCSSSCGGSGCGGGGE